MSGEFSGPVRGAFVGVALSSGSRGLAPGLTRFFPLVDENERNGRYLFGTMERVFFFDPSKFEISPLLTRQ